MSNYTQTTFFGPKDSLSPGDPLKTVKGTEVDAELDAISDAIATKADLSGPLSSLSELTAPGADRIPFWDHSALEYDWLNPVGSNSGLAISGTNMTLDITNLTAVGTLLAAHEFVVWNGTAFRKVLISEILHDSLAGFVADEHIDHTTVSVLAGTGLTGGGTIATNRTLNLDTASVYNVDHSAVSISAGTGLSGGGTIAANRTLSLDGASALNVDHSAVSISAGTGLTGGGTIAANRTLSLSFLGLEALTDPGADRIMFWDDSAGALTWLTLGTNLSITGTTINAEQADAQGYAIAYRNTTQGLITSATKIQFNASEADTLVKGTLDTSTNYRYTADETVLVHVDVNVNFTDLDTADEVYLYLRKNGSTIRKAVDRNDSGTNALARSLSISALVPMVATDYIEVFLEADTDGVTVSGGVDDNSFEIVELT